MSAPNEGRKRTPGPKRTDDIHFRVTPEMHEVIRELARIAGMTVSEFMITSAIYGRPSEITRIDPALDRHLAAVGNNVNQIARAANRNVAAGQHIDLLNVLMELKKITEECAAYAPKI